MQIEIIDGKLYQWDTGRKVRLTPDADESITEVHFGCQRDPEALVVAPEIGEEIAVCIPPEPLQKSGWLQVYVMTATDTPGKRTAYHVAEPIFARPKPVDYVFTPTERLTWESLDKRVAALEAGGGGSGGGGDGDSGVLYVTLTQNPTIPTFYTPSHTSAEILEAHENGKYVFTTIEETDNDGRSASVVLSLSMCNEEAAMFEAISVMDSNTVSVIVAGDMAMYAYSSTVLSGATADQNGHPGDVPAPAAGQQDMVLHGDGTWRAVEGGGGSGGGGEWRLLNDITTTEEIAGATGISLSAANDGTPYNLKEVIFAWRCPAAAASGYATFRVNGKRANGLSPDYFSSGEFLNNSERKAVCSIKAVGDAAVLHGTSSINNYGTFGNSINVIYNYPNEFETITSIDFTFFGDSVIPVGLHLKIWGLEA